MMESPAPTRRVWLFGTLLVTGTAGPLELPAGQLQSLFAYLILHPDMPHSRERLANQFWPEAEPGRGARNLSNLLYRLKQILGPVWFNTDGETLTLPTSPDLWVDVHTFEQLTQADSADFLQQALSLYRGDLLPLLYDDWTLAHRERLREKYFSCLLQLGNIAESAEDPQTALRHYRTLLTADPLREEAARGLMRALGSLGRFTEALEAYTELGTALQREIHVRPGLETRLLADQLRSEQELVEQVMAHPPARFVGRVSERARLLALLDRARQRQGGLVVILGEAGIGKTRLMDELANASAWRGWQVARGRADEFSLPAPYTPLAQALQSALPSTRIDQLAPYIPAVSLSIASAIVPGLPNSPVSLEAVPPDQLVNALKGILHGLLTISPHLFLLDDTHWADSALWPVLDRLRGVLQDLSALIVLTARTSEVQTQPLVWELLQSWDREEVPVLHLTGLNFDELRQLAGNLTTAQLERLAALTGGNPLFALQLIEKGDLEANLTNDLSLAELALQRVAPLSSHAQYALQLASVIGLEFDYSTWEAVLKRENIPVAQLPVLAGEAEQAGVIFLERGSYRFAHDTLRASIYTHIPAPIRINIHRQVLSVLGQLAPTRILDLLYHAQQAGMETQIARYAIQAGEQAFASFNYATAIHFFNQALEALPENEFANRYRTVLGCVRSHEVLAQRDAQREGLETLQILAGHLGDAHRLAETSRYFARYHWQTGNYPAALEAASKGLERATQANDREMQAALLEILGRTARDQGEYAGAKEQFEQALSIYQNLGNEAGQALIFNNLGILAQRQGYPTEAIKKNLQAHSLYHKSGDIYGEARALGNLGVAYWTSGDYIRARETFEQALDIHQQIGDRRGEIAHLGNLGGLFGVLGDPENALIQYEIALKLIRKTGEKAFLASFLANCGSAYYDLGQWEQALASLDEALALNREIGRRRGEGYVLFTRGITLIELNRLREAQESFEASLVIRHELGERDNLADTYCTVARFHLSQGNLELAAQAYQSAQTFHNPEQDSTENRRNFHYTSYLMYHAQGDVEAAVAHLIQAEEAMHSMALALPEPDRARFLNILSTNRKIRQALAGHSRQTEVRLVRADVPLGKKLTEEDYISVTWTLAQPGDDHLTHESARRQHILRRLLVEAEMQGAAPTDNDLAQALGVSRRTIIRDMQILQEQGVEIKTRQRGSGQ